MSRQVPAAAGAESMSSQDALPRQDSIWRQDYERIFIEYRLSKWCFHHADAQHKGAKIFVESILYIRLRLLLGWFWSPRLLAGPSIGVKDMLIAAIFAISKYLLAEGTSFSTNGAWMSP